jgi:hypothetical protein
LNYHFRTDAVCSFALIAIAFPYTMKTIKTDWNAGNYNVVLEALVDEKTEAVLTRLGLLYVGQRQREIDVALGIIDDKGIPLDENGEPLPEGAKRRTRASVAFSEDRASKLAAVFGDRERVRTRRACERVQS